MVVDINVLGRYIGPRAYAGPFVAQPHHLGAALAAASPNAGDGPVARRAGRWRVSPAA